MPEQDSNLLLEPWAGAAESPDFPKFKTTDFLPAFERAIVESRADIQAITSNSAAPTFDNTVAALERSGATLARVRRIFWMLSSAQSDEALRGIEGEVSAKLTAHGTEISHDTALFARVRQVWEGRCDLPSEAARLTDKSYKGFVAGGAGLEGEQKQRFAAIEERLGALSVQFGHNVLAATNAAGLVAEAHELAGIPADYVAKAAACAASKGMEGRYVFTLDRGVYESLLSFADDRSLRDRAWRTFTERCRGGAHDNLPLIVEILSLRREKATLLGYESYAAYALEDSMAGTPDSAEGLMRRVWPAALDKARQEQQDLQAAVDAGGGGFTLAAWDWRYFADRVRRERFAYDAAALRTHLTLDKVLRAAFDAAGALYGLRFEREGSIPVYHPDVIAWRVANSAGAPVGLLFTDYLARPEKHGGAWMGSLRVQEKMDKIVHPIVYAVANFTRSTDQGDALLSLDEARTLFHEFGHALHALLSDVTYPSLAGTSVARDFVEFPSKLMEHWVVGPEALAALAVPLDLIAAVERAEAYGQGFATIEFLASAMLDMALHRADPSPSDVDAFEKTLLSDLGVPPAIGPRHQLPVFTHVFDGGYASAYYSYLWSEVLDADVFAAFTASGNLYDPALSAKLRREVLAPGDSRDPLESFVAFRGRAPDESALLRARGLA